MDDTKNTTTKKPTYVGKGITLLPGANGLKEAVNLSGVKVEQTVAATATTPATVKVVRGATQEELEKCYNGDFGEMLKRNVKIVQ